MYTQLKIENFRGLRSLSLNGLSRVNLLVGQNNAGKTSVLEAIWLLRGAGNPELPMSLAAQRGTSDVILAAPDTHWLTLFPNLDPDETIEITGFTDNAVESLRLRGVRGVRDTVLAEKSNGIDHETDAFAKRIGTTEAFPITFEMAFTNNQGLNATSTLVVSSNAAQIAGNADVTRPGVLLTSRTPASAAEIASRFSRCQDIGRSTEVVNALRDIDPTLQDLTLGFSRVGERPILYMHRANAPRRLPFDISGGGGRRLLELMLAIVPESRVPVMIDEVEDGIYYHNLQRVWKSLDDASRLSECQLFVTTHSYECILAAINHFGAAQPDEFRIYRLESRGDHTKIFEYEYEVALAAAQANLEIR
jgi:predicted ATPase